MASEESTSDSTSTGRFLCELCAGRFSRKYTLQRHLERVHSGLPERYPCEYCKETFNSAEDFRLHIKLHRASKTFKQTAHSFNIASQYERVFQKAESLDYVFANRRGITEVIERELLLKNVVKASIDLQCTFKRWGADGVEIDKITFPLHSKYYTLYRMHTLRKFIGNCKADINMRMEDLALRGSNWVLHRIHKMRISTLKVRDLVGGCTNGNALNLKKMKRGQYLINPPSTNNGCFYYSIAYHLTRSMDEVVLQQYIINNFKHISINVPMRVNQIAKFERQNAHLSLAINVVHCGDDGTVYPLYNSKNRQALHRISLLLHFADTLQDMGHYLYITDFNKYASYRFLKDNKVVYVEGFYCHNCLQRFKRKTTFQAHIGLCNESATQRVIVPEEGSYLEFNSLRKSYPLPLIGFCDFEAAMKECEFCTICNDARECTHSTTFLNQHEAFAFCLMIFDRNNEKVLEMTYAGDDCVERLLNYLLDNEQMLTDMFYKNLPMTWSKADQRHFKKSTTCGICGRGIEDFETKVKHHEHYTGKYISAAHADCNLNARLYECTIPIFFHNLAGYDVNFIVRALGKLKSGRVSKLDIMPHNTEKIRKLDINAFSFMDSLDFLSGSLADITNDLVSSKHEFPLMAKVDIYKTEEQKALLLRKGVFPYGMVRNYMQLLSTSKLPDKEAFFSDLTQHDISNEDYNHAQKVWNTFEITDMLHYAFLYLRLDTILLSEAFIKFRNLLIDEENLDCCQFLSTPHLSFHLMLKITQVKLEYLTDITMIDFLKDNIRGGHSFINTRHVEADSKNDVHLAYWDCNNLYGLAQSELLPTDQYRWLTKGEISSIDWKTIDTESDTGMICEVDLSYPPELHHKHNSFILAPEQKNISFEDLSPYSQGESNYEEFVCSPVTALPYAWVSLRYPVSRPV